MVTLTLGMIAKDETEQFKRILTNYAKYFDDIVIVVDENYDEFKKIAEPFNARVIPYTWCNNFSAKRNLLHVNCKTDYEFRLDMDDAIINPDKIRDIANDAKKNNYSLVVCYYIYSKDEDGNTNAAHYRETIIKNTPNLVWQKPIHENIVPKSMGGYKIHIDDTIKIDHLIDFEHAQKSIIRNLEYLIKEYNQDKEKTDPRTLAYLGRTFFSLKDFDKAIFFLQKHIEKSGWDEDRYTSWAYLSEVFNHKGDFDQAIACANEALQERPDYPDPYFKLHDIYFSLKKWDKAITWGEMGFPKQMPKSMMIVDPSSWTWRPSISMAFCFSQIGEWEKANKFFAYAKKLAPNVKWIKDNEKYFLEGLEQERFNKDLLKVYLAVKKRNIESAGKLVNSLPSELCQSEMILGLKRIHAEPRAWGDNEICILCPLSAESWSPKSIDKGIGGSEEAVIQLSLQLSSLGYKVSVFNDCGEDEGVYEGVSYYDWHKFNPRDEFSHLVGWRMNLALYNFNAKNRIIWLHDIPHCLEGVSDDEIKVIDKIVVLSNYHKSLLPKNIPDEKIIVSTNGIVPEDFEVIKDIERQPQRIIYASSYDRGLETILLNWHKIRKECPKAELHIFYGWQTYDAIAEQGSRDMRFKPKMIKLMNQEGVVEHGRIGHKELLKEYAKSEILAYPCTYAGEINCISLTKGIACGCLAITNDFAVLKERNPHFVLSDDEFIPTLIDALKGKISARTEIKKYIQENSWKHIAKDWKERVFTTDLPVIIRERLAWILDQVKPGQKIVDIGSNKGHLFEGWDRNDITSVDIDLYDIPNFVRADAQSLPFEDNTFEVAVLAEILEHCPDPIKAISEAKRVAKKVIVSVPYEHKWTSTLDPFTSIEEKVKKEGLERPELARKGNPDAREFYTEDNYDHLYHHHFYTPELLTQQLKEAGYGDFKIYEIRLGNMIWLGAICG